MKDHVIGIIFFCFPPHIFYNEHTFLEEEKSYAVRRVPRSQAKPSTKRWLGPSDLRHGPRQARCADLQAAKSKGCLARSCVPPGPSPCASPCPQQASWISPSWRRRCKGSSSTTRWVSRLPGGRVFCLSVEITSGFLWLQMTLSPSYRMDNGKMVRTRTSRSAHVAVTQYQVLSSTVSSALLELHPVTGEGAATPRWEAPLSCRVPTAAGLCPSEQLVLWGWNCS